MKRREPPSPETFEKLLRWLDSDPDKAANEYNRIQLRLIRILETKGGCDAEDLADQAFNVAAEKIDWLLENYVGDPGLYLYAIAKNLHRESIKPTPPIQPPEPPDTEKLEKRSNCLDECCDKLVTPHEKYVVLKYYEKDKPERIKARRELARELEISLNALRIKVFHIQTRLRPCVQECVQNAEVK